jgi:hypothetical protein
MVGFRRQRGSGTGLFSTHRSNPELEWCVVWGSSDDVFRGCSGVGGAEVVRGGSPGLVARVGGFGSCGFAMKKTEGCEILV